MAFNICGQEPATVPTGDIALYPKAGQVCIKNDAGVETCFATAADIPAATPRHEAFDSDGGVTLNTGYQIVTMESEVNAETGFTLSGGGVQVATATAYKYSYKVSGDSTDGDRAIIQAAIFVNGVEVARTRSYSYHRTVAAGEDTAKSDGVLNLAANDIVTVRALIIGDNVDTIANASNLTLEVNS